MSVLLLSLLALSARPRWEPSNHVTEGYNTAIMAIRDGRPQAALPLLEPILAANPGCGLCQQAQAIALLRTAQAAEALAVLEVLAAAHDRAEVHTLRAAAFAVIGEHESARNAATRAVNQDPSSLAAQQALLDALLRLGEHSEAQRVLQLAHRRLPKPEAACLAVEYALAVDNQPGAYGAMSQCRLATDPRLILTLELALARAGGDLEAMLNAARALELQPLAAKIQAAMLLRQGGRSQALALLDDVLAADPDDLDALLLRAQCHQASGAINAGLRDLDRLQAPSHAPRLQLDGRLRQFHRTEQLLDTASALRIMLLLDAKRIEDARLILDREGVSQITAAASIRLLMWEQGVAAAVAELEQSIQRWPDAPQLPQVALQLTAEAAPSAAIIGWIQSLPDHQHTQTMAAQQHHQGHHLRCLSLLAPLSDPQSQRLAHRCAISAGDLDEANRRLRSAEANGITMNNESIISHAWLLGTSGVPLQGLALLERITPTASEAIWHRSVRVRLALEADTLPAAVSAADEGALADTHRAYLARVLYESGKHQQARAQMQQACAEVPAAAAETCQEALALMKELP